MGYESRVVIARLYSKKQDNVMDILAELPLSSMGGDFTNIFTSEWKAGYYDKVSGNTIIKDKYDKVITYTSFRRVYKWCIDNANVERYRRLDLLLAVLQSIERGWHDEIGDLIVIHYGY